MALQGLRQHAKVDAVARVHGDFHGFEFQAFQHLQAGVERRGFDGHQVAGLGDGLQAQVQGFQGAVGDQQLFHGQHQPADHVAQGDLPAQLRVARRHVGDHHARVHVAAGAGQRARQALQRKQGRAGERRAEGDGVRVLDRVEDREHQFADVDFGGLIDLAADHRLGKRLGRMGVDEVAGARPGADQAAPFEQVIGLEHRRRADAVGLAGVAHRRHALAGAEDAGADQFSDVVGEFFVAFHRVPGMVSFRNIEVTFSRASPLLQVLQRPCGSDDLLANGAPQSKGSTIHRRNKPALGHAVDAGLIAVDNLEADALRAAGSAVPWSSPPTPAHRQSPPAPGSARSCPATGSHRHRPGSNGSPGAAGSC